MSKTYSTIIKISETTLADHLIDNLASEHYGVIAAYAAPTHPNEMTVDFRDLIHFDGGTIDGKACRQAFEQALMPYHVSPDA